jgi:hypothetical protein
MAGSISLSLPTRAKFCPSLVHAVVVFDVNAYDNNHAGTGKMPSPDPISHPTPSSSFNLPPPFCARINA